MTMRAGAIIFCQSDKDVFVLLMKPSDPKYGGPDFQIPKGIIDNGENAKNSAIREAMEETGLKKSNIKRVELLHLFGEIAVYAIEVKNQTDFNKPDFEVAETRWFTLTEAFRIIRSFQVPMLGKFLHWLKGNEYA